MNKTFILLIALLTVVASCKRKLTPAEVEIELRKAMYNSLVRRPNYDSSQVKFRVVDVTYYEEKEFYDCEFKVRLMETGRDTTGIMGARVSKDFSKVTRIN